MRRQSGKMNIAAVLNKSIKKYLPLFSIERQKNILRYKFNSYRNEKGKSYIIEKIEIDNINCI